MPGQKANSVEWADRIRRLLATLKLSQAELAERLGTSPPTVSRWLSGRHEPTAESYVALGNLAGQPDGMYFWERAGIESDGFSDKSFREALSSLRIHLRDFKLIAGKRFSHSLPGKANGVAIPLLGVTAYGDRIPPHEDVALSEARIEEIMIAPLSWCPHPEHMVSIHLEGDSMLPVIPPGSILFVDAAMKERDRLHQRIAVVAHRDLGFKVARFQHMSGSDFLVSANYKYPPLDVSHASKWKIFGEVLWWISRDTAGSAENKTAEKK